MSGYADLGHAKLDMEREKRTGFPEVIFCEGKEIGFLREICARMFEVEGRFLGTRASREQYEAVRQAVAETSYDEVSHILCAGNQVDEQERIGRIAVCTAGTSDIPVAEEAAQTAEYFGSRVERYYDIGVSGLHRLLDRSAEISKASCIIAVAGMEGALASVIGGLVRTPVLTVPTSIGYGANFGGVSALLSMINSCANGVSVFNIDNGYGAGYMATQINRLAVGTYEFD